MLPPPPAKPIGLFFGSFNPIHWGHIIIADLALRRVPLQEVRFIPSPLSPFKLKSIVPVPLSSPRKTPLIRKHFAARLAMLQAALQHWPHFSVDDIEGRLPVPSYTAATLRALRQTRRLPHAVLIMGSDNYHSLHRWRESAWICKHFPICIYTRADAPAAPAASLSPAARVTFLTKTPRLPFAASELRARLKRRASIAHLVPPPVLQYLHTHPQLFAF